MVKPEVMNSLKSGGTFLLMSGGVRERDIDEERLIFAPKSLVERNKLYIISE